MSVFVIADRDTMLENHEGTKKEEGSRKKKVVFQVKLQLLPLRVNSNISSNLFPHCNLVGRAFDSHVFPMSPEVRSAPLPGNSLLLTYFVTDR
jgi:hypothetical protein